MTKKSKSQMPMLISILALLVALILIGFFIVPKTSEIKELSNEVAKKEQELELGKKKVASIREAIKLMAQAKNDIEKLNIAIPSNPNAEEALVQLQEIASKSGSVIIDSSVGDSNQSTQKIGLTLNGEYSQILDFLSKLKSNMRPVEISNYSMVSNEDESIITASFNLEYPYLDMEIKPEVKESERSIDE